jgi:hypothetical protein
MKYDPELADQLSSHQTESFEGRVYRATRPLADPTAPSTNGGRWANPENNEPVLYTSMEKEGALAEVCSVLAQQTPVPGAVQIKVTTLSVTTSKSLRLTRNQLIALGVDMEQYGTRDYGRTQEIGSTAAWLGFDSLIAPCARWSCDNLVLFANKHNMDERLQVDGHVLVEWREWAQQNGLLQ